MNRDFTIIVTAIFALGYTTWSYATSASVEDRAEAAAVQKAQITPAKAIQIAEQQDGSAYAIGMESTHRGNWYEVEILRGNQPMEIRIDPASGKVLGASKAQGEDAKGAHAFDGSKLTLAAAVARAERVGNGTAMEATSSGSGASARVIVDVVHGTSISHYRVIMANDQVLVEKTRQSAG